MSSNTFNKDNLSIYLKELGKEYRKLAGKSMPAEIILVGGGAILANYVFRDMTTDIDGIIRASSAMKDAVNNVADKFDLPSGWLNDDFLRTESYSSKLIQFSKHYRTFSNVLEIRTVSAEYLIAMKLKSGRQYKHDLSDIIGILAEHEQNGNPITKEAIHTAVENLYGSWENLSYNSINFIDNLFKTRNYDNIYDSICEEEKMTKELLIGFEKKYPDVVTTSNINSILEKLKKK